MGGVVRRYIDILILLIPTPLVLAFLQQQHPYFFVHFKKYVFVLFYIVCGHCGVHIILCINFFLSSFNNI